MSGVCIDLCGFAVVPSTDGRHEVAFAISIRLQSYAWQVWRTYAAMQELQRRLPGAPPLPPQRPCTSPQAFELCRHEILQWIHLLVSDTTVCSRPDFHEFLRASANVPPAGALAWYNRDDSAAAAAASSASSASSASASSEAAPAAGGATSSSLGAASGSRSSPGSRRIDTSSFTLLKVLGKGSFGKVMQVRKKDTGRIYAMKVLRKSHVIKKNQVDHTRTERMILEHIDHPFIVGLKYAFQSHDKLFLVLDYCAGGELFFHLGREGRFAEGRARFYTAQIVLALEHLHRNRIVYRDLKPENIMLDHAGNVKLTDFGLSKMDITDASTGAMSFCGTPEYLPPEVVGKQAYGFAADWWSLGALLHEMLTGWPPFFSQDREIMFRRIATEELTLPDGLSLPTVDFLHGLLSKDPRRRYGSGPGGADEIKRHPFFAGVDWTALLRREVPAPWVPNVTDMADTSFFDTEFTGKSPVLSVSGEGSLVVTSTAVEPFPGFTFVPTASSVISGRMMSHRTSSVAPNLARSPSAAVGGAIAAAAPPHPAATASGSTAYFSASSASSSMSVAAAATAAIAAHVGLAESGYYGTHDADDDTDMASARGAARAGPGGGGGSSGGFLAAGAAPHHRGYSTAAMSV